MPLPLLPYVTLPDPEPAEPLSIDLELELGIAAGSSRTRPGEYPNPEDAPGWVAKMVTRNGTVLAELPYANVKTLTKTLGAEDEITLESPKVHPSTKEIRRLREIQIYRNDDLKSWGVVTGRSGSSSAGARGFAARGLWWYFRKRFFGTATRRNMLTNGSFELGAATGVMNAPVPGWTRVGGARLRHWTAATKPGGHGLPAPLRGEKAISLDSSAAGENRYVRTRFSYRTEFPPGQRLTFAAWVWIGDGWTGPAALGLGLYVVRVVDGEAETQAFVPVDEGTPQGEWVRLECSMIVRPYRDGYVEVRLYSPGGWVAWDEAVSVLMESTGSGFAGADQTALAGTFVNYAQTGRGKSPLNIGTNTPATGIIRKRAFQHADHEWISDAVDEVRSFPDGFDHSIEITPTTRTFTTHFPMKGTSYVEDLTLRLGRPSDDPPGNLSSYSESEDAASVVTSMIARGRGDGPDREEGAAVDTSDVDGLVLDGYVEAPEDLLLSELDDFADTELWMRNEPVQVLEVTIRPGAELDGVLLIDLLETGDLVHVEIEDGDLEVDDVYRILKISIDCPTDAATLTLNRWTQ